MHVVVTIRFRRRCEEPWEVPRILRLSIGEKAAE